MASQLVLAHIEAERRLRALVKQLIAQIWHGLSGYDRENVDEWLGGALPIVAAGQRASVALTEGYLARALDRTPIGLDPDRLIGAATRNGTLPEEAYRRPFVTLWSDLGEGKQFEQASAAALSRAQDMAAFDVQASMRATAKAVQEVDKGIFGFSRAADPGACPFCRLVDGAYVKRADAMPLHNNCGCGLEPLTEPHRRAAELPSGVAVHEHGEMGPWLGDPSHNFTTESQALR